MRPSLMRALLPAILITAAGLTPALAQSRSRDSLNATNERLSTQSQIRGIQHQQQFENNQIRMQMQRNEVTRPAPVGPLIAPRR